ncbi:hypothetical protein [Mesorhizobium sp. YM1C-6-2]|uniref:hypothetical protein n=1 Tax=Mesorhizobium sp. YM1C-6-2 TaxID=1827501 RepID=UPI0011C3A84B|nr:hypothetical protein [Mesorhizobium sp. YM1C-6-2]
MAVDLRIPGHEMHVEMEGDFIDRHRRWLDQAGLLHRPWLFLGSAPRPTLPEILPADTAHVYIKYSGQAGKRLGLPEPDLIYVHDIRLEEQVKGLDCHRILAMTNSERRARIDRLWSRIPFVKRTTMLMSNLERDWLFDTLLGDIFHGVGQKKHPSNGIALIAYAVLLGVPQIIVAGMSLTDDGHSNPAHKKKIRYHKEEDHASFVHFAAHCPTVMTSEPELAELTGLPLFCAAKGTVASFR